MLDCRNNRFFFPWEQMFFLMQIIFIVLPSNMAAVQNLYRPVATNDHVVQNPPRWRASSFKLIPALGHQKQRQVKLHWFRSLCFNVPVRELIIMSLPSSMADFVPRDRLLQKAYSSLNRATKHVN